MRKGFEAGFYQADGVFVGNDPCLGRGSLPERPVARGVMKNHQNLKSTAFRSSLKIDRRGFTLVELLAVVACVGILAALILGAMKPLMTSAQKVREINAARNLIAAYLATASDENGRFLPGMDMRADLSTNPVYKPDGTMVANLRAAQRYPFRLAPYLNNMFDGTILVNKNKQEIQKAAKNDPGQYDYIVSAYPALGLNIYCLGGVMLQNGSVMFDGDCVTTSARASESILAFASAGSGRGASKMNGFCYVTPPTLDKDSPYCKPWSASATWNSTVDPINYGYVDFRYGGKAVCAFLDGSVRMCGVEELKDMRVWSYKARAQDDPNWTLQSL